MDYYTVISSDIYRLSCVAVSQLEGIDSSELKEEDILLVSEKINSDDPGLSTRTGYMSKFVSVDKLKDTLAKLLEYYKISSEIDGLSDYARKEELKTGNLSVVNLPNPYIISSMVFENGVPLSVFGYRLLDVLRDTIICVDYESLSVRNLHATNISSDNIDVGSIKNDFIQRLEAIVPDEATEENKLVDSSSMMSTIVRYSPTFRGFFTNWNEVKELTNYNQDEFGRREPDKNDYMVLSAASTWPYPSGSLQNTWRFRYVGTWEPDKENGWDPEYEVSLPPFTQQQWDAIDSGIKNGTKVWHEQDEKVGDETTPVYIGVDGRVYAGKDYINNIPLARDDRVGGFKLYGDKDPGPNNFPVVLNTSDDQAFNGRAFVHIPGATLSGGVGIAVDKEEGLIRVNPNNIETWTFTLRDENNNEETITRRFVVVNESCLVQVGVGNGDGTVSAAPGEPSSIVEYGGYIEISAFPGYGQEFVGWKSSPDQENYDSDQWNYRFMVAMDKSLIGYFQESQNIRFTQVKFADGSSKSYDFDGVLSKQMLIDNNLRPAQDAPLTSDWDQFEHPLMVDVIIGTKVTALDGVSFLRNCTSLSGIHIPEGIVSFPDRAFHGTGITAINVPETIKSINAGTFASCKNLSSISIPSVSSINSAAFQNCTNLTNVEVSQKLSAIGKESFRGCSNLSSIYFPPGVDTIRDGAFYGCSQLSIPIEQTNLSSIGLSSFAACGFQELSLDVNIKQIGSQSFKSNTKLSSLYIGPQLTSIGTSSFIDCTNLESVTLPDSGIEVQEDITQNIFTNRKTGCKFYIYGKDQRLSEETENWLTNYEQNVSQDDIQYIGGSLLCNKIDGKYSYKYCFQWSGTITAQNIADDLNGIDSPSSAKCVFFGQEVTGFEQSFHEHLKNYFPAFQIHEITIPSGVSTIPQQFWTYSDYLERVTVEDGVDTILSLAFFRCTVLRSVILPNNITHLNWDSFDRDYLRYIHFYIRGEQGGTSPTRDWLHFIEVQDGNIEAI